MKGDGESREAHQGPLLNVQSRREVECLYDQSGICRYPSRVQCATPVTNQDESIYQGNVGRPWRETRARRGSQGFWATLLSDLDVSRFNFERISVCHLLYRRLQYIMSEETHRDCINGLC